MKVWITKYALTDGIPDVEIIAKHSVLECGMIESKIKYLCKNADGDQFYLAGSINKTSCPCSMCEKEFSYVPYIEQWILQEVEQVAERLTVKAPSGLIHLVDNSESGMNQAIKKLAEYETAEEEGRLVVLPCKVGTRVYEIYQFCGYGAWEIEEHKIKLEDLNKIGKTVFLTREKAEKALKEMRDKHG